MQTLDRPSQFIVANVPTPWLVCKHVVLGQLSSKNKDLLGSGVPSHHEVRDQSLEWKKHVQRNVAVCRAREARTWMMTSACFFWGSM